MSTNLEVFFCDLCNLSVPQTDIESGRAVRIKERVIGACCAGMLAKAAESPQPPRASAGAGVVATGIVALAGIAGAAAFLDWRFTNENGLLVSQLAGIESEVRSAHGRLGKVEEAVGQLSARLDFGGLVARMDTIDTRVDNARNSIELRVARIEESLVSASEASRRESGEQRGVLDALKTSVLAVQADVATLRARPLSEPRAEAVRSDSNAPVTAAVDPPATKPDGADLPADLKHQVLSLSDEDPGTRFAAVDKLLRSKDQRVLPAVVPMAKDANLFVRRLTAEGLREFRCAASVETLLIALADPEPIVRLTASKSLGALTAQRIEFDDSTQATRATAQRRWQEWWDKNRATFTF